MTKKKRRREKNPTLALTDKLCCTCLCSVGLHVLSRFALTPLTLRVGVLQKSEVSLRRLDILIQNTHHTMDGIYFSTVLGAPWRSLQVRCSCTGCGLLLTLTANCFLERPHPSTYSSFRISPNDLFSAFHTYNCLIRPVSASIYTQHTIDHSCLSFSLLLFLSLSLKEAYQAPPALLL